MKVKLRYRIVLEGEYFVDPIECGYDEIDADSIADQERDWAAYDIAGWVESNFVGSADDLTPTEVLILPA